MILLFCFPKLPKIDNNYLWPIIALVSACLLKIINALLLLLVLLLLYTYKFENAIKNFKLVYQYVNYYFFVYWILFLVDRFRYRYRCLHKNNTK